MEILIFIVLSAGAAMAAICFSYSLIWSNNHIYNNSNLRAKIILWLVYGGMGVSIAISGRSLNAIALLDTLGTAASFLSTLVERGVILVFTAFIAYSAVQAISAFRTFEITNKTIFVLIFFCFGIASPILAATFGTNSQFSPLYLMAPLVFISIIIGLDMEMEDFLRALKGPIFFLLAGSCLFMILAPAVVLEPYSIGKIPLFKYRLWGLTLHSNTLGPLGFLLLLTELCVKSKSVIARALTLTVALSCFTLAQSKTAWIAGLFSISLLFFLNLTFDSKVSTLHRALRFYALALVVFCVVALLALNLNLVLSGLEDKSLGNGNFSGRPAIWTVAVSEWLKNPIFGYGPSIWSSEFRQIVGMNFAFHAHNQFYQIIGESGLIGLSSLVIYVSVVMYAAYRDFKSKRYFLLVYLIFVIIRSFSEPTLRLINALGGDIMVHLPLFVLTYIALASRDGKNKAIHSFGLNSTGAGFHNSILMRNKIVQ